MSVMEEKLIRMGEQITDNMRFSEDDEVIAARVADHLGRFWDPRMKAMIIDYEGEHGDALSKPFQLAIQKLKAA
jgi:formate dehydrogenase subunit delta